MRHIAHMDIKSEIGNIEQRASRHAVSIRSILRRAGFANSNWARWKTGKTSPSFKNWKAVNEAADSLISERETSSPGSTAGHDAGSDPHPIHETELSPRSVADPSGQRGGDVSSCSDLQSTAPAGAEVS